MKPVWMWYRKTLFDWFNFALFLPWVFLVCAPSVLIVYAMPFCFLPIHHASHQIRINIINSLHFIRVFAALQLMKLYLHTNRFPQTWNSFRDMISDTWISIDPKVIQVTKCMWATWKITSKFINQLIIRNIEIDEEYHRPMQSFNCWFSSRFAQKRICIKFFWNTHIFYQMKR